MPFLRDLISLGMWVAGFLFFKKLTHLLKLKNKDIRQIAFKYLVLATFSHPYFETANPL